MSYNGSRRKFLRDASSGLLYMNMLPVLPSLILPTRAHAAGTPPLRFIVVGSDNGIKETYWPKTQATAQLAPEVYGYRLSTISGPVSDVFGTAFDGLRDKFSIIRGMGIPISAYGISDIIHNRYSTWSLALNVSGINADGYNWDPPRVGSSLDCVVAYSPSFYQGVTPLVKSLIFTTGHYGEFSYWRKDGGRTANVQGLDGVGTSVAAFNQVFPKGSVPSGGTTTTTMAGNYQSKLFQSLVNQMNRLTQSSALSAEDRVRLSNHTDLINDLQRRVLASTSNPTPSPATCTAPAMRSESLTNKYLNFTDTIVAAFACDRTRVAVLDIGDFDDQGKINWDLHHNNSHGFMDKMTTPFTTDSDKNYAMAAKWQADRIAYLMQKLNSVVEADGSTLLDNTVIVWSNEHGNTHSVNNLPVFVAGSARGKLKMGEYLDYRLRNPVVYEDSEQWETSRIGRPLTNLWMSIMAALGIPSSEYLAQGEDGAYGEAPTLSSGYVLKFGRGDRARTQAVRRELLPYFYKQS